MKIFTWSETMQKYKHCQLLLKSFKCRSMFLKLCLFCSCISGGVRVGTSTLLQDISTTQLWKCSHILHVRQESKEKDSSAGSKTVWKQGEDLAGVHVYFSLKKSYLQSSADSGKRYITGLNTETRVYMHTIMKHIQRTDWGFDGSAVFWLYLGRLPGITAKHLLFEWDFAKQRCLHGT